MESFHSQRLLLLYFAVVGADILGVDDAASGTPTAHAIADELRRCYDETTGGFCAVARDEFLTAPTLTMTHCALRVLESVGALQGALDSWLAASKTAAFVKACSANEAVRLSSLPLLAGGFAALPGSAEVDVRFTYSALMVLRCLNVTPAEAGLDVCLVGAFIMRSFCPLDGGFGSLPGAAEAHGGMTFCAVASLSLLGMLHGPELVDVRRKLRRYCAMRLGTSFCEGEAEYVGIQGRPNKPCDTCYTHWVGCTIALLGMELDDEAVDNIIRFVMACQDHNGRGGIAKEADVYADPMHTCLALSGLAVLAHDRLGLRRVSPDTGLVSH